MHEQLEVRVRRLATAHAELTRRMRELDAANTAIVSISSALDLSQVLQTIVDAARELLAEPVRRAWCLRRRREHYRIHYLGHYARTTDCHRPASPRGHGLLGELIREGRPLRIPNIAAHPQNHGFPPNHPPMTSLLGCPILYHGIPVGDLYLTDKIGADEFSV